MSKPFIFVYGNCQAAKLERGLSLSPSIVDRFQLFTVPNFKNFDDDNGVDSKRRIDFFRNEAGNCEIFVYQSEFWDRNSQVLMEVLPVGCVRVPVASIRASSLWPFYFKDLVVRRADPALGEFPYGDTYISKAVKTGEPVASIVDRYLELDVNELVPLERWHQTNMEVLRQKERTTVTVVADFIEERFREAPTFTSPNHPTNPILRRAVDQILVHLGYAALSREAVTRYEALPDICRAMHLPIHPSVVDVLGGGHKHRDGSFKYYGEMLSFRQWAERYAEAARATHASQNVT